MQMPPPWGGTCLGTWKEELGGDRQAMGQRAMGTGGLCMPRALRAADPGDNKLCCWPCHPLGEGHGSLRLGWLGGKRGCKL